MHILALCLLFLALPYEPLVDRGRLHVLGGRPSGGLWLAAFDAPTRMLSGVDRMWRQER